MPSFEQYFLMNTDHVKDYVKANIHTFKNAQNITCLEIGDGNLNYVYRVLNNDTNDSVIVKQAGTTARISDEFVLSTTRNKIETEALILQHTLAPGLVPEIYLLDETMSCCVMEDLSHLTIMRTALTKFETFPNFAEHITDFMVNTLLRTSDVVLNHKDKKELVRKFINPELCEISEDLVFTEPFHNQFNRNEVTPGNEQFVQTHLYSNEELHVEVAKLKFHFMNNSQSLLHGDLHTGSIFIDQNDTKMIDPEFAFFGPMGYDIGNIMANLIFAWARGDAYEQKEFTEWVEHTLFDVLDLFDTKFNKAWDEYATEVVAKNSDFKQHYMQNILKDTAGMAGLELARRIVGLAKVKDITTIEPIENRLKAERLCLRVAQTLILNPHDFSHGGDYVTALQNARQEEKND
ncbi:S-methyl-5-thioribose kinase [Paenisporosarcina antarctica]|uniref:S-methyl-5-thioribose kinase n=1 Tax=Paenisporosarcina antarctica TaxID=417367 RepID=A0A4P7A0C5_9BACL|nr:S-methyl-5-thioribose kinase [Paenisporosarcina antarctica]QBP42034.1 S-methyl-5-thioribose kinase [Paenisporosarcina antarctica]